MLSVLYRISVARYQNSMSQQHNQRYSVKMGVKTKVLIISDTHADDIRLNKDISADVVIHCGDLTEESTLAEYRKTLKWLGDIKAPLKLVIAGNNDFTLDTAAFRAQLDGADTVPEHMKKDYGDYGEARRLINNSTDVIYLDEGTHQFNLGNGACMTVYASAYTPSRDLNGFRYPRKKGHHFDMGEDVDVVITHGPPHGIMDYTHSQSTGCLDLFEAIARARPRLHCFGHVHDQWGARLLSWREPGGEPSHGNGTNSSKCKVIMKLSDIRETKRDPVGRILAKRERARQLTQRGFCSTSHCAGDEAPLEWKAHTLFVNAAARGEKRSGLACQPPWLVQLELPRSKKEKVWWKAYNW
ncbi:ser/Thr protein phosphatase family protein [Hypoxylon argillaceum]|nr:ser/Thr protein phosphatase family protein [Hypoxylon argillaceum]